MDIYVDPSQELYLEYMEIFGSFQILSVLGLWLSFFGIVLASVAIVYFALWLLRAIALFCVSRKLGSTIGWFAFFPLLDVFLQGRLASISDKRRKAGKKPFCWGITKLAVALIARGLAALIVPTAYIVTYADIILSTISNNSFDIITSSMGMNEDAAVVAALLSALLFALFCLTLLIYFVIVFAASLFSEYVVRFVDTVVNFKIYRTFANKHAVWMILADLLLFWLFPTNTFFLATLGFSSLFKAEPAALADKTEDADETVNTEEITEVLALPVSEDEILADPEVFEEDIQVEETAEEISDETLVSEELEEDALREEAPELFEEELPETEGKDL